jgi:hypothetical protein
MSSEQPFDPYYEWLAIPPAEQPPDLYRLLGVQKYESDPQVIENAADRQMLFLRQFQSSPRWPYAEALLNTVARARVELLQPARKQAYDRSLQQSEHAAATARRPIPVASVVTPETSADHPASSVQQAIPLFQSATGETAATPAQRRRNKPPDRRNWVRLMGIILGGPMGIAIGIWLANMLGYDLLGTAKQPQSRPDATAQRPAPKAPENSQRPSQHPSQRSSLEPKPEPAVQPVVEQEVKPSPVPRATPANPVVERAAPPVDVVAALPASVDLPPTTNASAVSLFAVPGDAAVVEWAVRSGVADLPAGGSICARRANSDPRRWNVLFAPDPAAVDQGIPIAKLVAVGSEMQFQWTAAAGDEKFQTHLRNCCLEAKSGAQTRSIQLRRPLELTPLALDLNQDQSSLDFELSDLPPAGHLLLEVTTAPKGSAFEDGAASASVGKPVVIQFAELTGAEISLRLQQKGTGQFTMRATPEFVEGPRLRFELTRPKLAEMTKRWNEMGQKAALTIKQTQARIAALQDQLDELSEVSGNISVMTERARQMKAVNERIKIEVERLPSHRKRLVEAEARLKAAPKVEAFLASHDQSVISFRVIAQSGPDQIVLAEAR